MSNGFTMLLLVVSKGTRRQTYLIFTSEMMLVQMKLQFYLYSQISFDGVDSEFIIKLFKGSCLRLLETVVYIIVKIIDMDCVRLAEKTQTHFSIHGTIIQNLLLEAFPIDSKEAQVPNTFKRQRQWSTSHKFTYGKLLLYYLMNHLQANRFFLEHLADLMKKTYREVSIFHRKMISQHKTAAVIVTHVLRHRTEKRSHQTLDKLPSVSPPCLIALTENFRQQEQELNRREQDYLRNLVFAEESLEQYEEDLSDSGEVLDLNGIDFVKQEKTNDSFDFDDNNEEEGYGQDEPSDDQPCR